MGFDQLPEGYLVSFLYSVLWTSC